MGQYGPAAVNVATAVGVDSEIGTHFVPTSRSLFPVAMFVRTVALSDDEVW